MTLNVVLKLANLMSWSKALLRQILLHFLLADMCKSWDVLHTHIKKTFSEFFYDPFTENSVFHMKEREKNERSKERKERREEEFTPSYV